jgi:hypothetical protein
MDRPFIVFQVGRAHEEIAGRDAGELVRRRETHRVAACQRPHGS